MAPGYFQGTYRKTQEVHMSLSPNQERFAQWLAVPKELGLTWLVVCFASILTDAERVGYPFCRKQTEGLRHLPALLDVCPTTLSRWKQDPDFQAHVYRLALNDLAMAFINALAGLRWPGLEEIRGEGISMIIPQINI
jgi:hypothetical protein